MHLYLDNTKKAHKNQVDKFFCIQEIKQKKKHDSLKKKSKQYIIRQRNSTEKKNCLIIKKTANQWENLLYYIGIWIIPSAADCYNNIDFLYFSLILLYKKTTIRCESWVCLGNFAYYDYDMTIIAAIITHQFNFFEVKIRLSFILHPLYDFII